MGLIPSVAFFGISKKDLSKEVLSSKTSFHSFITSSFEEASTRLIDRDSILSKGASEKLERRPNLFWSRKRIRSFKYKEH